MAPMSNSTRGELQFTVPLTIEKFAASGDPKFKGRKTMRGYTAVFNQRSHDLGGFRTEIDPAFFDEILATNPDVHLVRDHNFLYVLGRTKNGTLEFSVNPEQGLAVWAMFPKTPTADETATLMEEGYIDQMSFACDIGEDVWYEDADGTIVRRLLNCTALYDATICAQGAFPQTESHLAASLHDAGDLLASAKEAGRITKGDPDLVAARGQGEHDHTIAPSEGGADVAEHAKRAAELKERVESRFSQYVKP